MASLCLTYIILCFQEEVITSDGYRRIVVNGKQIFSEKVWLPRLKIKELLL